MLLRAVPISSDLDRAGVIGRTKAENDTSAPAAGSHALSLTEILRRTLPSGVIH